MDEKINVADFTEETYWVAECPSCGELIEVYENPDDIEDTVCQFCNVIWKVGD